MTVIMVDEVCQIHWVRSFVRLPQFFVVPRVYTGAKRMCQ